MKTLLFVCVIFLISASTARADVVAWDPELKPPTLESNRDELIRFLNPDHRDLVWADAKAGEPRWVVVDIPRMSFGSAFNAVMVKTRYQERGPRRWTENCEDVESQSEPPRLFTQVIELSGEAAFAELRQLLGDARFELEKRCDRRVRLGDQSYSHFIREIIWQNKTGRTLHCV